MGSVKKVSKSDGRKKFAAPPVKVACLVCRSSRVRCDGGEPCKGCAKKGKSCVYTQSRRGGPRFPGLKRGSRSSGGGSSSSNEALDDVWPETIEECILPLIEPGAGLVDADDYSDTDNLFDSIFCDDQQAKSSNESYLEIRLEASMLRLYSTIDDLLVAYYIWLHPFFPILPPSPASFDTMDDCPADGILSPSSVDILGNEAASPLLLAISAVLVLIPHPKAGHLSEESQILRRQAAHNLATRALDCIENDSELPESASSPSRALTSAKSALQRNPMHPQVPVELEATIALCFLSVYEYAQRGNLAKMRQRAMLAFDTAMELSLHFDTGPNEQFAEARRRTWWMSYMCACQASIVGCTATTFSPLDARFSIGYPTNAMDGEAWSILIQAQRAILSATQFVRELNGYMERKENMPFLGGRMKELDGLLKPLILDADSWCLDPARYDSSEPEAMVARSMRLMAKIKLNSARIKVHRYCAFFDIPVFTEKHCDLKDLRPSMSWSDEEIQPVSTCCSATFPIPIGSEDYSSVDNSNSWTDLALSISRSSATSVSDCSNSPACPSPSLPFSSHVSSRICLKSALSIARAFGLLPFPSAAGMAEASSRTMPSFACCAMQSAYALLMMHHKTSVMLSGDVQRDANIQKLLSQCESGLQSVLAALENYSISFEALRGMRDQVRDAVSCLAIPFM